MKSKIKKTTISQASNTRVVLCNTPDEHDKEREYDDCEYFPEY